MASQTYDALNKAWKSTCRVLFGSEAGELSSCAEWLKEYNEKIRTERSSVSGKTVSFSQDGYSHSARFLAFDEIDFGKKFAPLSINEIKDIDSISQALSERASYCGNVVLGRSSFVEGSNNVSDSHYVMDSTVVADCKYVAYSHHSRFNEYCFGLLGAEKDTHSVKCMGSELTRCFECHMVESLADCYYCAKSQNCRECLFCFGTENASYMVGNTALSRDKYLSIKKKLLSDIAAQIKKNGRALSLLGIVEKSSSHKADARLKFEKEEAPPFDPSPIERAFSKTSSILFGRELSGLANYDKFLWKHIPKNIPLRSPLSGNISNVCAYRVHLLDLYDLRHRMVTENEMRAIGRVGIGPSAEGLSFGLDKLVEMLHPIAYHTLDKVVGKAVNLLDATVAMDAQDCMHGSAFVRAKKCSHCFWPSDTEAVFGSYATFESSFCMKNYSSKRMSRAFECDGCESCADMYFSHNCENVRDSMFCFNAKNLSYAIGNAPLAPEAYRKIKQSIVSQLADELEKKKDLKWDIFNIGAARKA